MKRLEGLMMLGVLALAATQSFGQQIAGPWTGQLDLGAQKLTLVLHFDKDASGKDVCTMDSPDQSAKGIPATLNFISADSVNIAVPSIGMTYAGKLSEGELKGTFSQMGMKLPLDMKPGVVTHNRPQHPVEPYPYQTKDVAFQNVAANAWFAGTLVYPEGYKEGDKVPVLIMVTGSGAENRDEEVFDHKPFLVIADYLARHGVASLRFDDRGVGKSTGSMEGATTKDFAEDALAGIEMLRGLKQFSKVGVLGHSEGGSVAFMLGAKQKVDFIISMAGVGAKGDTALTAQANRTYELMGVPMQVNVAQYRAQVAQLNSPWLNYFLDYDPIPDIQGTRCPVLAINGDKDVQVVSSLNLKGIEMALPKNKKNLVKEFPGLNHLFQHCTTGLPTEYAGIEETISEEVLGDIATWINGL
ncbi:MAG: alpha/beta hydrolase [Bacteroidales bacterium]|nr:alpha/beta hydrolase [Bacteroidales bacterium]